MTFLKNTWYCLGWSHDLKDTPNAITILNQRVVFYRGENGTIVALEDKCPHRFAPLSKGKINGDNIACGYHGLEFDSSGNCVKNPHGDGAIPKNCNIKSYPAIDSQGIIWIWMGDPEKADTTKIVDLIELNREPGWSVVDGYIHVKSHYELLTDNLLDLSHVPFLHSFLSSQAPLPENFRVERSVAIEGDAIWSMHSNFNMPITPLYQSLWDNAPPIGTMRANMRWNAPAILYLDTGFCATDGEVKEGACFPGIHLITPETEHTSHYFWAVARNVKLDDTELSKIIYTQIDNAFRLEDEPMVEACDLRMPDTDLLALNPVYLAGDVPGVRVRGQLKKLISQEALSEN